MKTVYFIFILLITIGVNSCNLRGDKNESSAADPEAPTPEVSVKFSGVKPYYQNGRLDKEVTFLKGVRNGLTKSYYPSGGIKQSIYYTNGLKADTAKWFYEDGSLFRTTPYMNDTIHGIQCQYYRSGRVKASMSYVMGNRVADLEEYYDNGKLKIFKRNIAITIKDDYPQGGNYKIFAELNNKSTPVKFYRGDLNNGIFDSARSIAITTSGGVGFMELSRSAAGNKGYAGIIAEYTTDFGNRNYIYKRVPVPYRDIN
jgi:antitoxin component YwqK of YwqJK toxin-antitoxin module